MEELAEESKLSIRLLLGYVPVEVGGPLLPTLDKEYSEEIVFQIIDLMTKILELDTQIQDVSGDSTITQFDGITFNYANQFRYIVANRFRLLKTLSAYVNIPIAGRPSRSATTAVQYQ